MMADLLEHIYQYYLIVPREVVRIRREQHIYRELLRLAISNPKNVQASSSPSKAIRDLTVTVNWPRLFLFRVRRLLITISPLTVDFSRYRRFVSAMERHVGPAVPYISWIFFAPRLLTNLFLTMKHVLPGPWMGEHEHALGWQTRFIAQMQRRWFELGNDAVWLTAGLINCFVLTGILGPISFFVGAGCQAFDLALASVRAHIEINRLKKIEKTYVDMLTNPLLEPDDRKQIQDYLSHLQHRITHEKKRVYLSVINNSVLLLAVILILPVFASIPVIPLIGAILAVLNTILCYNAMKYIDQHKPSDKIQKESLQRRCSFFNTPPTDKLPPEMNPPSISMIRRS